MKKLILIAIALIGLQATAQQRGMQRFNNLTPEEAATLQTKKMTLHLDLTEDQQEKVYDIHLKNATVRKAKMEAMKAQRQSEDFKRPTKEERLARMNARLDNQIAMKKKMKSILTDEQYAKWETLQADMKNQKGKKGMKRSGAMKRR